MENAIQSLGPTVSVLLMIIFMLIRDRRGNNSSGNPTSVNLMLGGMDEKLSGIQKAVEDIDEGEEKRHNWMRGSVTELQKAIDRLTVTVGAMDERTKRSGS